jgi:hypothetical protein
MTMLFGAVTFHIKMSCSREEQRREDADGRRQSCRRNTFSKSSILAPTREAWPPRSHTTSTASIARFPLQPITKRQWFSGKIHRCHRWAPRSIRG